MYARRTHSAVTSRICIRVEPSVAPPSNTSICFRSTFSAFANETIKAMNIEQPALAGGGIRAIAEGICRDRNAEGKDLFLKINSLVMLGVLTIEGAETLHKVRSLENIELGCPKAHIVHQQSASADRALFDVSNQHGPSEVRLLHSARALAIGKRQVVTLDAHLITYIQSCRTSQAR